MGASLNERQLGLLRRVAEGHQPDSAEAASVYALRSRGLLTTRSAYAYCTATVTEIGGRLLAEDGPQPPPTHPPQTSPTNEPPDDDEAPSTPAELLEQLAEHGGKLVIADPTGAQRAAWRRLLHATREQHVDNDKMIRHRGRTRGDLVIWLATRTTESTAPATLEPVPMPERVIRPHPMIGALRTARADRDGWIDTRRTDGIAHVRIHRRRRTRAIRLLHALATEATRRRYTVGTVSDYRCPGGLGVTINGHSLEMTIHEESKRVPHRLTAAERRRRERSEYLWAPTWDREPTGRLVLRHGHDSSGGNLAADRVRWTLEDRLALALQRLEQRAIEAEQRRVEHERRQAEWQRLREQELVAEEQRRIHRLRVEHLDDQVSRWRHARDIRGFVAAVDGSDDPTAIEWLEWATRYAESIDPLAVGIGPPELPEPTR